MSLLTFGVCTCRLMWETFYLQVTQQVLKSASFFIVSFSCVTEYYVRFLRLKLLTLHYTKRLQIGTCSRNDILNFHSHLRSKKSFVPTVFLFNSSGPLDSFFNVNSFIAVMHYFQILPCFVLLSITSHQKIMQNILQGCVRVAVLQL